MRRLLLLAALSVPLAFAAVDASARAGGGQGYSGGSSGGSSGGYSGGGYSGSSYSGSYRSASSDEGLFGDIVVAYFQFVFAFPLVGVPLTLFFAYMLWSYATTAGARREEFVLGSGLQRQNEMRLRGERDKLLARDPGFDEKRFLARVADAFLKVQSAWSKGDMTADRAFLSDGVYERFTRQLADLRGRGLTNVMQNVKVLESEVLAYVSDAHFDAVHVWVRASALDRTVDAKGDYVRADDGAFEEVWAFLRRPTAKTLKAGGGIEGQCPSCGARLALADAGQCAACKTWVNSGQHDWVLAEITQRSEWTAPDPTRDVDGWRDFSAGDPALNMQALEDRASVMFWRWLEALRRGATGPLRPVATDACARALLVEAEGSWWQDAAVGGADLIACERAGAVDRLHVLVKWEALGVSPSGASGSRARQKHFFVLERAAGAKTDGREGLRTLRCPSCGAPPAEKDEAACAYCSKPFNDGSRDWVLCAIVPFGAWRRPASLQEAAPVPMPGVDWDGGLAPAEAAGLLARAMFADGEATPHERRYLTEYCRARGITGERVSELIASAQCGLLDAPRPRDGGEAEAMLRGLIRMSLADGRVTDDEKAALASFGRRFGLHNNDVSAMVDEERGELLRRIRT